MGDRFLVFRDTDIDNSSGSALLAGSPIIAYGASFNMSGGVYIQDGNSGTKTPFVDEVNDNGNLGSNLRRLMPTPSTFGIHPIKVSMGGGWTYDAGSLSATGSYILTPTKLLLMCTRKRPMYVYDGTIIPSMIDGDQGIEDFNYQGVGAFTGSAFALGSAFFSKYGAVFIPETWNLNSSRDSQIKAVGWSITGRLDNGSYDWS